MSLRVSLFIASAAAIVARKDAGSFAVVNIDSRDFSRELRTALRAAEAAAAISREYYRGNFTVKTKADRTPVTEADVECEERIRDIILGTFPGHGFCGEETGESQSDAEHLWLVDPIDGTKGFIRQYPFFSTQIALMNDVELVI